MQTSTAIPASTHALPSANDGADHPFDPAVFRQGMRQLVGGVTLITTRYAGRNVGLTATAVCSLSATPPRLLACVNSKGATYKALCASRRMCVNVLAFGQLALARRFSGMVNLDADNLFDVGDWLTDDTRPPMLRDALAAFDCHIDMIMDTNSHGIVIGDIQNISANPGRKPLLYSDGQFTTFSCPSGSCRYVYANHDEPSPGDPTLRIEL
jgi:flavin reductase (DIM6/NTAB) family NADH-FMN oxidoreductase RutF